MLKMLRRNAAARVIPQVMGSFLLLGCTTPKPPMQAAGGAPAFTVDTPLDVIAADPGGKAVLVKDVPGMMASSKYPLFEDMSLAQIAIIARGKLPKHKLDEVQADLDRLAAGK